MKALRALLAVAYPFLIFAGLAVASPRAVALLLAGVFALRGLLGLARRPSRAELRGLLAPAAPLLVLLACTAATDDARLLLALPVLVNLALLFAFARTLAAGPSFVERIARLRVPDLPAEEVAYCRSVTLVWCGFFAVNAGVALWLALRADPALWALYNGFLAYLAVGALYAGEFLVRAFRFGRYEGTPLEPLLRRWRPVRTAAPGAAPGERT